MTSEKPAKSTLFSPNIIAQEVHRPIIMLEKPNTMSTLSSPKNTTPEAHRPPLSPPRSPSSPTSTQYAIHQHAFPSVPTSITRPPTLISTAPSVATTNAHLPGHASAAINPSWGATKAGTSSPMTKILGPAAPPRPRYTMAPPHSTPARFGMLVTLADATPFVVGGFASLGEVSHAVKVAARGYVAGREGVRVMERSVEVVGADGKGMVRYEVVEGVWDGGQFVADGALVVGRNLGLGGTSEEALVAGEEGMAGHEMQGRGGFDAPAAPESNTPVPDTFASPAPSPRSSVVAPPDSWCVCRGPDDGGLMIECENRDCDVQWYHGRCLGISTAPTGKWYCASCVPSGKRKLDGENAAKGGRKKRKTG